MQDEYDFSNAKRGKFYRPEPAFAHCGMRIRLRAARSCPP